MAPSNVFSYVRPHHRRNHSNPSSPDLASLPNSSNPSSAHVAAHNEFSPQSRLNEDAASDYSESPISARPSILAQSFRTPSAQGFTSGEAPPPPPKTQRKDKIKVPRKKIEGGKSVSKENLGLGFTWETGAISRKPLPHVPIEGLPTSQGGSIESPADGVPPSSGQPNLYGLPQSSSQTLVSKSTYPPPSITSVSPAGPEKNSQKSPNMEGSHQHKSTRGRLNLLNPMSLLMRRRSSQALQALSNDPTSPRGPIVPAMTMPDDYDPRIRGNRVHDFSAPRPQRVTPPVDHSFTFGSTNRMDGADGLRGSADSSPSKVDYAPAFKENFEDELRPQELDRAVRAEQLANRKFLQRASFQPPPPDRTPPLPPSKSTEPPTTVPQRRSVSSPTELDIIRSQELRRPLSLVEEMGSPHENENREGPLSKSPEKSPPVTRSRAASGADSTFQPTGIPTHTTSKASRFSFQILGNDSAAQEKILEERHKQKAAARALAEDSQKGGEFAEDDFDEDAMYEDMMNDYDDFEETIPGMEDDDMEYGNESVSGTLSVPLSAPTRMPYNNPLSPISAGGESYDSPDDIYGGVNQITTVNGLGTQGLSLQPAQSRSMGLLDTGNDQAISPGHPTVASTEDDDELHNGQSMAKIERPSELSAHHYVQPERRDVLDEDDNDDLYFDDGMIDDPEDMDGSGFDESAFDDPSNPLYERQRPVLKAEPVDPPALEPQPSVLMNANLRGGKALITDPIADLDNLNAYHSALAFAANRAEADGRFNRQNSIDLTNVPNTSSPSQSQSDGTSSSRPSLVPDDGRFSMSTMAPFSPTSFGIGAAFPSEDDYSYNDFDSSLEDDPMIAEANADVLAYDSDEDYGQEFGFYASASSQGESTFYNGGYFGPRDQMLGRSTSGRNAVREPNLTPITERSEYSTRNSFISISNQHPWHGTGVQPAVASPGLAQLARMSPFGFPEDDSDISLEKLMKLRRDAFGGSSGSIGSNNSSPRNSLPGEAMAKFSNTGLVNGSNWIPWDLESSSAQGTSNGASPDGANSMVIKEQDEDDEDEIEDQEALDAINALSASDSDESEPHNSERNISDNLATLEDSASESGNESPTLTGFEPGLQSTPKFTGAAPTNAMSLRETPPRPKLHIPGVADTASDSNSQNSHYPVAIAQLPSLISPLSPMSPFAFPSSFAQFDAAVTSPTSPTVAPGAAPGKSHSRKTSAADSVTYVREKDERGEQRWVLERRRTASTGEMELVGREIVEGGRI